MLGTPLGTPLGVDLGGSPKLWRYFAPSIAGVGSFPLSVWPDTGESPLLHLEQGSPANQPTSLLAGPSLKGLRVVRAMSDTAQTMAALFYTPHAYSFGFVAERSSDLDHPMKLVELGGDVSSQISVWWDPVDGFYVAGSTNVILGPGSTIAIAVAVGVGGGWQATFSIDWAANSSASGGSNYTDPMTYIQIFGIATTPSVGSAVVGEVKAWSALGLSPAQRNAELSAFRTTWGP